MGFFTEQRVVVTGLGIVAPNAIGKDAFWESLKNGTTGTKRITLFDVSEYHSQIAGEITDFDLKTILPQPKGKVSRMSRQTRFAVGAATLAIEDSGVASTISGDTVVPVFIGVGNAAVARIEQGVERMQKWGPQKVSPAGIETGSPHQSATQIGNEIGFPTVAKTVSSACTAGVEAIGMAADIIRSGQSDVAVAGGTDSPLTKITFAGFDRSGFASAKNDDPEGAARPFDRDCDSGVVSEGSGVIVLENYEHALARGAHIYMEILSIGSHSDYSADEPLSGLAPAMELALANAHKGCRDIDYINAHGPGHPLIDYVETQIIKQVFGDDAYKVPITSIKGNIGNPMAAAGPMQLVASALALENGVVPYIVNHVNPARGCDLDYVTGYARKTSPRVVLVNSHGLGGSNACMVVQKVDA